MVACECTKVRELSLIECLHEALPARREESTVARFGFRNHLANPVPREVMHAGLDHIGTEVPEAHHRDPDAAVALVLWLPLFPAVFPLECGFRRRMAWRRQPKGPLRVLQRPLRKVTLVNAELNDSPCRVQEELVGSNGRRVHELEYAPTQLLRVGR